MAGVVPQDHGARHSGDHEAKVGFTTKSSLEAPRGSGDVTSADQLLESLGYAPEMTRNRSTMQVAFMSFVMAAIPYGLSTTMYYPLAGGGPTNVIWGWLAVSCIILCVAASLGEITSVYPTAGGVYYQTFMLSPPRWRRVAGWVCGWLYVVGNVTITLAVNFGTAQFLVASIGVFETADGESIFPAETYQVFLIFLAITLLCNAVSALGDKWLPWLDTAAIYWTFAGLISIVVCILAIAKNGRHSAEYVFTTFEPRSGWTPGWSFCVGLLQAAYATSSTGMIISYVISEAQVLLFFFLLTISSQHVRGGASTCHPGPQGHGLYHRAQHLCRPVDPHPDDVCAPKHRRPRRPRLRPASPVHHQVRHRLVRRFLCPAHPPACARSHLRHRVHNSRRPLHLGLR